MSSNAQGNGPQCRLCHRPALQGYGSKAHGVCERHWQNGEYWPSYEARVQAYERQGITRSDAQGIVDGEDM